MITTSLNKKELENCIWASMVASNKIKPFSQKVVIKEINSKKEPKKCIYKINVI